MVDVWDFYDASNVKLTCTNGKVYEGLVLEVCEPEEDGLPEDSISIEMEDGRIYGIMASQIEEIERI